MDKKGVSSVVAAVLLILLTVSAITVLASIVVPFVKNNLYGSTDCIKYENYFSFVEEIDGINYNCYNNENLQGLMIKTKPNINGTDEKLEGFQISFLDENSQVIKIDKNTRESENLWEFNTGLNIGGNLYYPNPSETITYVFRLDRNYKDAEIRPVLSDGKICEASDSIKLRVCDSNINLNQGR